MFGDRAKTYAEHAKNAVRRLPELLPEKLSMVHRAGIILFAGLLHGAVYEETQRAEDQIEAIQKAATRGSRELERVEKEFYDSGLRAAQSYRSLTDRERLVGLVQYIQDEFDSGRPKNIEVSRVLAHEEFFVEGVPQETLERGMHHYQEVVQRLKALRNAQEDPTVIRDEILNAILAEQGRHESGQISMYALLDGAGGNCVARAKLIASLLNDVFPEYRGSPWILVETYRGYVDSAGNEKSGHVRIVLDFADRDTYIVMEGDHAYSVPRRDDHVTRTEMQTVFVNGSASAMGVLPGPAAVSGYTPRRLHIPLPESSVRYLGQADGSAEWWQGKQERESDAETSSDGSMPVDVQILDEAVSDEMLERHMLEKRERMPAVLALRSFMEQHKDLGFATSDVQFAMDGREGKMIQNIVVPLGAPPAVQQQAEQLVSALRIAIPETTFATLYGVTSPEQQIVPLVDPESEYLFLAPPTAEQIDALKGLGGSKRRVFVKDVAVGLREYLLHPSDYGLAIFDPITTEDDLENANGLSSVPLGILVEFVLDLPKELKIIAMEGDIFCTLRNPDALQGVTLDLRGGRVRIGGLRGSVPSLVFSSNSQVSFLAAPSSFGNAELTLGAETDITSIKGFSATIEFRSPVVVREGWEMKTPADSIKLSFLFLNTVAFEDRSFSGAAPDTHIRAILDNDSAQNMNALAFEDLTSEIIFRAFDRDTFLRERRANWKNGSELRDAIMARGPLPDGIHMSLEQNSPDHLIISGIPEEKK